MLVLTTDLTSIFNLEQEIMKVWLIVSSATVALFHLDKSEHTFAHSHFYNILYTTYIHYLGRQWFKL